MTLSCTPCREEVRSDPPEPYLGVLDHTPVRHHILSVLVENRRCPGAYRGALRASWVQHLFAGGSPRRK